MRIRLTSALSEWEKNLLGQCISPRTATETENSSSTFTAWTSRPTAHLPEAHGTGAAPQHRFVPPTLRHELPDICVPGKARPPDAVTLRQHSCFCREVATRN